MWDEVLLDYATQGLSVRAHPVELLWRGRVTAGAGRERRVLGLGLGAVGLRIIVTDTGVGIAEDLGEILEQRYRDSMFGDATLQDLPDEPRFVINATNVQSGVIWRFMKPYMRDYRVGEVRKPTIKLAKAVAAFSRLCCFDEIAEAEINDFRCIQAVMPSSSLPDSAGDSRRVYDLGDVSLLPGLVEAHTQYAYALFFGLVLACLGQKLGHRPLKYRLLPPVPESNLSIVFFIYLLGFCSVH